MENNNNITPFNTQLPSLYGGDPAVVAAAETAKARIQSAYIMAIQKPRDTDQARQKILRLCDDPEFAEKVEYSKPIGNTSIKGLSIRFAESALAEWGNILSEVQLVYDDNDVRRIRVSVIDLQTNTQFSRDVTLKKTVERRSKRGRDDDYISERKNTYGKTVYLLRATEDEMMTKEGAMASKFIRTEGLRLLPASVKQEAVERSRKTLASRDKADPDAAKKRILDAFSGLNIWPNDIKKYLRHSVDTLSPSEIAQLRTIYTAIDSGEASWVSYMQKKDEEGKGVDVGSKGNEKDKQPPAKKPSTGTPSNESEINTPPEFAALVKDEAGKPFKYVATDKENGVAHDNLSAYIEMVALNSDNSNCEDIMDTIVSTGSFPGFWSGFMQGNWKAHFKGKLPESNGDGKEDNAPPVVTPEPNENTDTQDTPPANAFDLIDWKTSHMKSTGISTYFYTHKAEWNDASEESKAGFREKWARVFKGTEPFPLDAKEDGAEPSIGTGESNQGEPEVHVAINYAAKLHEYHENEPERLLVACKKIGYDNIVIPMGKSAQKDLYEEFQMVSE